MILYNSMIKILFTLISIATISLKIYGQPPEGLKYQAVLRNPDGMTLNNKAVAVRFTIQQGSIGGIIVYNELFLTSTSTYGLVNLELGFGSTTDDFSIIDWSNGPYFLETAVNFLSGTPWLIMGTSQLLSVPYAFHTNTVDSLVGGITNAESDSIFIYSLAGSIAVSDTSHWNGFNDTDTQLDSIEIASFGFTAGPKTIDTDTQLDSMEIASFGFTAGPKTIDTDTQLDSVEITSFGFTAGPHAIFIDTDTQLDSSSIASFGYEAEKIYSIGMYPELGGYVFKISSDGKHGLVSETQNQGNCTWYSRDNIYKNPANYSVDGQKFYDWRLPTKHELNEMYLQRFAIGGNFVSNYWTSTEYDFGKAYAQIFGINSSGWQFLQAKNSNCEVRAVRSF